MNEDLIGSVPAGAVEMALIDRRPATIDGNIRPGLDMVASGRCESSGPNTSPVGTHPDDAITVVVTSPADEGLLDRIVEIADPSRADSSWA